MNKIYVILATIFVLLVPLGGFVIYSLESANEDSDIDTLLDAFWWSTATITTVGYGDLVLATDSGKIFAMFFMFSGITTAGIFMSLLGTRIYRRRIAPSLEDEHTVAEKKIIKKIEDLETQQKQNNETLEKLLKKLENQDQP